MLEVRDTQYKGRGVFTTESISPDTIVERSPVVLLTDGTTDDDLLKVGLDHYCYDFEGRTAFACGFGSLFNHSSDPNCDWFIDQDEHRIVFSSNRSIAANEELTIDYGVEVWFDIED